MKDVVWWNVRVSAALPGKVYLTGAGPGSAKLLTVRALEVLKRADIVLHDDLVSEEVLALIPSHTAVYNVGKRCGIKKTTQDEINRRMIAAARSGRDVVRLKGGDPSIFGRTQEEIDALRHAKIEFEIVPGITAASAAAAVAEIPLTDRNHGSHLVISSNHACPGKDTLLRGQNSSTDATLVFYMPGSDFVLLREELVMNGIDENTPCLLVSQATLQGQQLLSTTVGTLVTLPSVPAPSILIVGQVTAGARGTLNYSLGETSAKPPAENTQEFSLAIEERESLTTT